MDKITLGTKKVSIEFPGVKALSDCDFEISTGMIHSRRFSIYLPMLLSPSKIDFFFLLSSHALWH